MLDAYLTATAQLLQNPAAPTSLYAESDLAGWINSARGQLAGEAACIRVMGTLPLTSVSSVYAFSAISVSTVSGVQNVFNVRQVLIVSGSGYQWVRPRPFEWFTFYRLNNVAPVPGQPTEWSQYGQGTTGSLYVNPTPDQSYTFKLDTACQPIPLIDDATVEAIPYPWTDAVPYFAAYLALLSAQNAARQADADRMFNRYTEFVNRARRISTPEVLPNLYPQQPSEVKVNQLGLSNGNGGGGQR